MAPRQYDLRRKVPVPNEYRIPRYSKRNSLSVGLKRYNKRSITLSCPSVERIAIYITHNADDLFKFRAGC